MRSVTREVPHDLSGTELIREWIPETVPKATVVLLHGLAEHSGRYERTGDILSDAGFWVRSFDVIGHGGSGGRRVDIEDWDHFHDQIHDHMEWARGQGRPVVVMGHSMGALLATGYVLDRSHHADLVVLSAPTFTGGAVWQRMLARALAGVTPTLAIAQKIDGAHLSRDPGVADAYFSDPLVHTKATVRFGKAFFDAMDDARSRVGELPVRTLALHGGNDRLVPTESSAFLEELPMVERRVYPGLRHEIFNEPEGPQVVAEVIDWINDRI